MNQPGSKSTKFGVTNLNLSHHSTNFIDADTNAPIHQVFGVNVQRRRAVLEISSMPSIASLPLTASFTASSTSIVTIGR